MHMSWEPSCRDPSRGVGEVSSSACRVRINGVNMYMWSSILID